MGEKITWELVEVDKEKLKPNPNNPKIRNEAGMNRLKKSIEKFGLVYDGICNRDYSLIDGHSRLEIKDGQPAKVFIPSRQLSEYEQQELNAIFDVAKAGEPDVAMMETMFEDDFFEEWEIEKVTKPEVFEDNFEADPPKNPITVLGDLYEMGSHRLLCGDSANSDDVARLMNGKIANLFSTDPPYGVAYNDETGSGAKGKIQNDENDGVKLQSFLESIFSAWLPFLDKKAAWYLWHAQLTQGFFAAAAAAAADILIHRQIIWVKPSLIMGHGDYHWRHELCFYGWRKGNRPNWYADRKQDTIWNIGRETDKTHPTAKPVEIFARPMLHNTQPNGICAEPFAGSGTQFIAADQLNRACYGQEISEAYCDLIVARFLKHKPDAKIKRNGIEISGKEKQAYLEQIVSRETSKEKELSPAGG